MQVTVRLRGWPKDRGLRCGPLLVTHRRPGPGKLRALLDRHTCVGGRGHRLGPPQVRHSGLTHLGEQGVSLLLFMAKSRHKSVSAARKCFKPGTAALTEVTRSPQRPLTPDTPKPQIDNTRAVSSGHPRLCRASRSVGLSVAAADTLPLGANTRAPWVVEAENQPARSKP